MPLMASRWGSGISSTVVMTRTHGPEGVEGLGPHELLVRPLEVSGADVVDAGVAEHVGEGVRLGYPPTGAPDDHPQLGLQVDRLRQLRIPFDGRTGADDGGRELGEQHGLDRGLDAALPGMVVIVEADRDELARTGQGARIRTVAGSMVGSASATATAARRADRAASPPSMRADIVIATPRRRVAVGSRRPSGRSTASCSLPSCWNVTSRMVPSTVLGATW